MQTIILITIATLIFVVITQHLQIKTLEEKTLASFKLICKQMAVIKKEVK